MTPEAFARDPALVESFYDARRRGVARPGDPAQRGAACARRAGTALARPGARGDPEHRRPARARRHADPGPHAHGELLKARCLSCAKVASWRDDLAAEHRCPACGGSRTLRSHVVWFGDLPLELDANFEALSGCALFVAIGTSGQVYPPPASSRRCFAAELLAQAGLGRIVARTLIGTRRPIQCMMVARAAASRPPAGRLMRLPSISNTMSRRPSTSPRRSACRPVSTRRS